MSRFTTEDVLASATHLIAFDADHGSDKVYIAKELMEFLTGYPTFVDMKADDPNADPEVDWFDPMTTSREELQDSLAEFMADNHSSGDVDFADHLWYAYLSGKINDLWES